MSGASRMGMGTRMGRRWSQRESEIGELNRKDHAIHVLYSLGSSSHWIVVL